MAKSKKWGMFIVLYFSCFSVGITQNKVPPILGQLAEVFDVSLTSAAWLSNIYYVTGIILSIPGAFILNKYGPKKTGLAVLFFLALGGILGVATSNYYVMLFSRVLEGVGFTFSAMLGIVLINLWFEGKTLGIIVGIFSTFSAAAAIIMLNFGAIWSIAFGWKFLWYISIILSIIMFIFFAIFIKIPEKPSTLIEQKEMPIRSVFEVFRNGRVIILGLCFASSGFVMLAFANLYVTIFVRFYGLAIEKASFYSGFFGICGVVFSIICGFIIAKMKKPERLMLFLFVLLSFVSAFAFKLTSDSSYLLHVILISTCTSMTVPIIFSLAPKIVKTHDQLGAAMSIINLLYITGALISAPVVTYVLENVGWTAATIPLVAVSVLGVVFCLVYIGLSKRASSLSSHDSER